ncbi:hypothetical protein PUN28_020884 [Cardiocondyla obscurior]|uniref:Uncharacterized protein n=1 Tax=Cardiocondyla obscurior TaxID=286306 RepID=A0AAW2E9I8_9HYME
MAERLGEEMSNLPSRDIIAEVLRTAQQVEQKVDQSEVERLKVEAASLRKEIEELKASRDAEYMPPPLKTQKAISEEMDDVEMEVIEAGEPLSFKEIAKTHTPSVKSIKDIESLIEKRLSFFAEEIRKEIGGMIATFAKQVVPQSTSTGARNNTPNVDAIKAFPRAPGSRWGCQGKQREGK